MSTFASLNGPGYAVDGKVVLDGHAGQCIHTIDESNPWITIDLGAIYAVKYVTLVNRLDTYGNTFTLQNSIFENGCRTRKLKFKILLHVHTWNLILKKHNLLYYFHKINKCD
jgi:hypothetical protein